MKRCISLFLMIFIFVLPLSADEMHQHGQMGIEQKAEGEICPVSGEPADKNISYIYEDKTYYFCCSGCIEEFKKNPQEYILSGELKEGIREINVEAYQYGFKPDPVVVRKDERIRLLVKSIDVTHGIGISEFKVNEALPKEEIKRIEFVADKTGTFTIHCSVYCGPGHSKMQGRLIVR